LPINIYVDEYNPLVSEKLTGALGLARSTNGDAFLDVLLKREDEQVVVVTFDK
jgi:hypothetical protein